MVQDKMPEQDLKVFGTQSRNVDRIRHTASLIEEIQKLKSENRDLTAKNKRLVQIMNDEGKKEEVEDGG